MTLKLASRISAAVMAATVVITSWAPTLATPHVASRAAPIVATR